MIYVLFHWMNCGSFKILQATTSPELYYDFKNKHKNKLIIFISHATGKEPSTKVAQRIMYDADLKIWVEGYKALSKGRYIGTIGEKTIWAEGANRYWGSLNK